MTSTVMLEQTAPTDRRRVAQETFDVSGATQPNFFLVGGPKCGTTTLFRQLLDHPAVFLTDPKEPNFWATDYPRATEHKFVPMGTLEDYLRLFEPVRSGHRLIGEASTCYLSSREAIPNIVRHFPDARFVACVRNPLDFLPSFHDHQVRCFEEDVVDFEEAWGLQAARARGERIPPDCLTLQYLQYADMARFGAQIERFCATVPETQRKVVVLDDLQNDPAGEYARLLDFLGLPHDGRTEFPRANEAHQHRFPWLTRLVRRPPRLLERPMRWIHRQSCSVSGGSRAARFAKGLLQRPSVKARLRPEFRTQLCDELRDDVDRLGQLLERNLSHWLK